ncbi:MAG: hypothetical protein AAFP90_07365 [Planctomycetota bacterium]
MSDIEDFLRRAAQRRAQQGQGQAAGQARPTPQQRMQRQSAEPPMAIPVDERPQSTSPYAAQPSRRQQQNQRRGSGRRQPWTPPVEETIPVAEIVDESTPVTTTLAQHRSAKSAAATPATETAVTIGSAAELIKLLQQPQGIVQAMLLKEIIDRPQHRW